jgi:prevent-host-death family protein
MQSVVLSSAVIAAADGFPIAILNRNTPAAYLVPAKAWENTMDLLEDIELAKLVLEREGQEEILATPYCSARSIGKAKRIT